MINQPTFGVSDFVAVFNQTIEYAYPRVAVIGELANFRVSKNRWVYFDLKDESSQIRCFGSVYMLPGPLEDGMLVKIKGSPRLHPQFSFSFTVDSIELAGEGTLKKAAKLLEVKLHNEGLFAPERKRPLPYPPRTIGLITSGESAAYADFVKIINSRWQGLQIYHVDVQVQGENAPSQITKAIEFLNQYTVQPEVIVVIRGGGSSEDLQAFSTEQVARAIAGSRIPTLVAIGHEVDSSLAEMVADKRASTPSNAAEVLVPDKQFVSNDLSQKKNLLTSSTNTFVAHKNELLHNKKNDITRAITTFMDGCKENIALKNKLINLLNPHELLRRGFALVYKNKRIVNKDTALSKGEDITVILANKSLRATINNIVSHNAQ